MGHQRLGYLPRTRRWEQVVALLAGGAEASQIANAAVRAAERMFARVHGDTGVVETLWLSLQLPLAARGDSFQAALRDRGLRVSDSPGLMEILSAFTSTVDARLSNNCGRSDLGEIAQLAAVETFAGLIAGRTQLLFDSGPDLIRQAFADLATTRQISILGRHFFARLMYRCLDFFLSRTLPEQLGPGRRFSTPAQVAAFSDALATHCGEAARIVEIFSGEWFSRHQWETDGNITRTLVADFAHGSMQKLLAELQRG